MLPYTANLPADLLPNVDYWPVTAHPELPAHIDYRLTYVCPRFVKHELVDTRTNTVITWATMTLGLDFSLVN